MHHHPPVSDTTAAVPGAAPPGLAARAKPRPSGEIASLADLPPHDRARWGNKAARLADLAQAGFPVPPGFCIPVEAYHRHIQNLERLPLDQPSGARDSGAIREQIMRLEFESGLAESILEAARSLFAQTPAGVAVRSSSNAEDLEQHSFAGLYESVLGVKDETGLLQAVRSCWASYWSEEAVEYREKAGLDHRSFGMAVLVQVMVPAAWAGVLFTRAAGVLPGNTPGGAAGETRSGTVGVTPGGTFGVTPGGTFGVTPDVALIEYVRGGGEALMSGAAQAERLLVDRSTFQPLNPAGAAAGPGGTPGVTAGVKAGMKPGGTFGVTPGAARLLLLGLQLEQNQGETLDVEWAIDPAGQPWVLQVRPVTVLPQAGLPPTTAAEDGWLITYDEPFSPLGCQIAIQRYGYWIQGINDSFKTAFKPEIRNQDGLLYYRPTWRSPGLPLRGWMLFWRLANWLNSEAIYRRYVNGILPAYERRLRALRTLDLPALDLGELLACFNLAIDAYLEYQRSSYAIGSAATLSASLLDSSLRYFFGHGGTPGKTPGGTPGSWNALDLLTGIPDESTRRELRAARLGQALREVLAGEDPASGDPAHLDYTGLLALEQRSPAGRAFWEELRAFLDEYGYVSADRYPRDPAWELNHEALVASLQHAAQTPVQNSFPQRHAAQQQRRLEAVRLATTLLSRGSRISWRARVFRRLLQRAEKLFPFKENRNHHTYLAILIARKYALEIGSRLRARGLLPSEKDVFFLEREEIARLCTHQEAPPDLLQAIEMRKKTYLRSRSLVRQPDRRDWDGEEAVPGSVPSAQNGWLEVRGDACSPGFAKGPARLVSGLGELQRVQPGDIIVCTQLRPAWSPVFARAGGAVIEMGSLLSHGSTLAREYGVPVVINVAGVSRLVRENDWLVVDGNLGKVAILSEATAASRRSPE